MSRTSQGGIDMGRRDKITLRKRGQFTLPKEFIETLNLKEGDTLEVQLKENGVLELVPLIHVRKDQAWYWKKEWQKGEQEADEDIKNGRVHSFDRSEDLIEWLDSDDEE